MKNFFLSIASRWAQLIELDPKTKRGKELGVIRARIRRRKGETLPSYIQAMANERTVILPIQQEAKNAPIPRWGDLWRSREPIHSSSVSGSVGEGARLRYSLGPSLQRDNWIPCSAGLSVLPRDNCHRRINSFRNVEGVDRSGQIGQNIDIVTLLSDTCHPIEGRDPSPSHRWTADSIVNHERIRRSSNPNLSSVRPVENSGPLQTDGVHREARVSTRWLGSSTKHQTGDPEVPNQSSLNLNLSLQSDPTSERQLISKPLCPEVIVTAAEHLHRKLPLQLLSRHQSNECLAANVFKGPESSCESNFPPHLLALEGGDLSDSSPDSPFSEQANALSCSLPCSVSQSEIMSDSTLLALFQEEDVEGIIEVESL